MPDWIITDAGTIVLFTPVSEAAREHGEANFPDDCPTLGDSYAVEHRYAPDIIDDLAAHDFNLQGA